MSIHLFISLMLSLSFRFRWYCCCRRRSFPSLAFQRKSSCTRLSLPGLSSTRSKCPKVPLVPIAARQKVAARPAHGCTRPAFHTSLTILPPRSSNISGAHCRWSLRSHMAGRWRCQAIRLLRPLLQYGLVFEAAAKTERSSLSIWRAAEIR